MSNYSLPLFMQVKANAVTDLNKNLNLYMPKLVFAKTLILTTEGLLQTLDRKVKILLNQLRGYERIRRWCSRLTPLPARYSFPRQLL